MVARATKGQADTQFILGAKGYNLEHNFGHGKNNLSAVLATLNLIAFAIHRAAELADVAWIAAIEAAGARARFFDTMRALTAYLIFPSWPRLLHTLAFRSPAPASFIDRKIRIAGHSAHVRLFSR